MRQTCFLYGDAGTGKSSTVKAIINEYQTQRPAAHRDKQKRQVSDISAVIEKLRKNPLKFILFIDDLSFSQENDDLYELKAALEGSVSAKSANVAIYATSNRRHLIKETFLRQTGRRRAQERNYAGDVVALRQVRPK